MMPESRESSMRRAEKNNSKFCKKTYCSITTRDNGWFTMAHDWTDRTQILHYVSSSLLLPRWWRCLYTERWKSKSSLDCISQRLGANDNKKVGSVCITMLEEHLSCQGSVAIRLITRKNQSKASPLNRACWDLVKKITLP